jgi:hypothetical protein
VLTHQFRGELVQKVVAAIGDATFEPSDASAQLRVIATPSALARELAPRAAESTLVPASEPGTGEPRAVAENCEVDEPEVDSDRAVWRTLRRLRGVHRATIDTHQ